MSYLLLIWVKGYSGLRVTQDYWKYWNRVHEKFSVTGHGALVVTLWTCYGALQVVVLLLLLLLLLLWVTWTTEKLLSRPDESWVIAND